MMHHFQKEWRDAMYEMQRTNPQLLNRIGRKLMNYLFKRNPARIEAMMTQWLAKESGSAAGGEYSDNQPKPRLKSVMLEEVIDEIFHIASEELSEEEISHILTLWLKSERSRFLTIAAERRDVSLDEIKRAVIQFNDLPAAQKSLTPEERIGVRAALIRRFLSEDLDYLHTLKDIVTVSDFADVLHRVIGPPEGNGKLGGKAAGIFRAEKIIRDAKPRHRILEAITVPKTWYITSDGILEFMHLNALEEMPTIKYRDPAEIRQEYPYIEQIFKNSSLTAAMMQELARVIDDCPHVPLVVRSSSLLEDLKGSAFAGKYKSLFVANQGNRKERLDALVDAILEVYASVFSPDPIEYRRDRGLLDFNEEMAIMIQEVVGTRIGQYFFPACGGVAFSFNEFRMSPRIKRNDGIVRMVAGLGTRAVDRVSEDYPFFVSPGQPGIRANISPLDRLRYSQRKIDVINLAARRFETRDFVELVRELGPSFPMLSSIISLYREGHFFDPVGTSIAYNDGIPVVSFSNLLNNGVFIPRIRTILSLLEDKLGTPVDIEFACADDRSLHLLQCRPQSQAAAAGNIAVPVDIPHADRLFSATRYVTAGQVRGIEFIVYVDPFGYESLETREDLLSVGRVVGELNALLPHQKFILMGPGRWGSRGDIKLGVSVGYADIHNTAMLIEIARKKHGYVPELSFGTHFFQDLVESRILYLPLYPDEPGIEFNEEFFRNAPNCLADLVPDARPLEQVVRVIRIAQSFPGASATVVMDGDRDKALAYIDRGER